MRLLIDTDTAGDDCFSIMLAARHPGVTLEAITICNGNVDFQCQVENALKTLEVSGLAGRVPVYAGCRKPLLRKPVEAAYVFGLDGMSDRNYPPVSQRPAPDHAVDAIIRHVMASPGEITILAQAPLTNLALAVSREPAIAKAVKHLWIMGGTDQGLGNVTPAAEFNFYVDPEAAQIVLNAGFPISLVTWTLTLEAAVLTGQDLDQIAALGTERARFFTEVNQAAVDFCLAKYGTTDTIHPDSFACACAINEAVITAAENCLVEIETASTLTRAYSSISSARLPPREEADPALGVAPAANARVIKAGNRQLYRDMMLACLA